METPIELIFHPRAIPGLQDIRGPGWRVFVQEIATTPDASLQKAAFVLLMARLCGCLSCDDEGLRAAQGCGHCSRQTISKFKGSDDELLAQYGAAYKEVNESDHLR